MALRFVVDRRHVGRQHADAAPGADQPDAAEDGKGPDGAPGDAARDVDRRAVVEADLLRRIAETHRAFVGLADGASWNAEPRPQALGDEHLAAMRPDRHLGANSSEE